MHKRAVRWWYLPKGLRQMKTKNCNVCILGDSYSTFRGHIPEGNSAYYPYKDVDDVLQVEHTWWN